MNRISGIGEVLAEIVRLHGTEAVFNGPALLHYYAAMAPDAIGEYGLLQAFVNAGGAERFRGVQNKDRFHQQKAMMETVSTMFVTFYCQEDAAMALCETFWEVIGGSAERLREGIKDDVDIEAIFAIFKNAP